MSHSKRQYENWIMANLEPDGVIMVTGARYKRETSYMFKLKKDAMIQHIGQAEWEQKNKEEQDRLWRIWDKTHK